jgi:hypothetical protein
MVTLQVLFKYQFLQEWSNEIFNIRFFYYTYIKQLKNREKLYSAIKSQGGLYGILDITELLFTSLSRFFTNKV